MKRKGIKIYKIDIKTNPLLWLEVDLFVIVDLHTKSSEMLAVFIIGIRIFNRSM